MASSIEGIGQNSAGADNNNNKRLKFYFNLDANINDKKLKTLTFHNTLERQGEDNKIFF